MIPILSISTHVNPIQPVPSSSSIQPCNGWHQLSLNMFERHELDDVPSDDKKIKSTLVGQQFILFLLALVKLGETDALDVSWIACPTELEGCLAKGRMVQHEFDEARLH